MGFLSHGLNQANSTQSCPGLSCLLKPRAWKAHFWLPWPWGYSHLSARACTTSHCRQLPAHSPSHCWGGAVGFLGYFSLTADTSAPMTGWVMLFPQHILLGAVTSSPCLPLSLSSKDIAILNSKLEDSMLLIQVMKLEGLFQQGSLQNAIQYFGV